MQLPILCSVVESKSKLGTFGSLMLLLRKSLTCDYVEDNNRIIIVDHKGFRYISCKRNNIVSLILKNLSVDGIAKDQLLYILEENGYNKSKSENIIKQMLSLGIIVKDYFPNDIASKSKQPKIKELSYSNRYGLEIAALKAYETKEFSRFDIFDLIQSASVTIIGAGGIGSNLAVMLAAFGIGRLKLVDGDTVEESNLIRQIFYKQSDCGSTKKVFALKRFIQEFNPNVKVDCIDSYIKNGRDANLILNGSDLVVQTADKPKGKIDYIINSACVKKRIPVLYTHNQSIGPFYVPEKSICYKCFAIQVNEETSGMFDRIVKCIPAEADSVYPAMVTGPWIFSYYIFNEILRFLLPGRSPHSLNGLLLYKNGEEIKKTYSKLYNCKKCAYYRDPKNE